MKIMFKNDHNGGGSGDVILITMKTTFDKGNHNEDDGIDYGNDNMDDNDDFILFKHRKTIELCKYSKKTQKSKRS